MKIKRNGFTIIEMMLILLILSLLYAIAAFNTSGIQEEAKISRSKGDLKTLELSLNSYFKNKGLCPVENSYQTILMSTTPRILSANLKDPFAEKVNTLYKYNVSGNRRYYVVYSVGMKRDGSASINNNGAASIEGLPLYETNGFF